MSQTFSWEMFNQVPVVGIMRNLPVPQMEMIASHFQKAGLTTLEITMNSPGAAETIASLVRTFGGTLNIGAGTVCSPADLEQALAAGAQFIVTPILREEVVQACVAAAIPVFPGAYTPSEIYRAWDLGASMVKVFPATQLGPTYVKEVLAPLNHVKLLPTGGVTLDNFTDFLKAGAHGVGVGSGLFPKDLVEEGSWEKLGIHLSAFVKKLQQLKMQG